MLSNINNYINNTVLEIKSELKIARLNRSSISACIGTVLHILH